jgi:NRAMP (natural resistance-associated macrophage protein)-like metal ion transporter
MKQSKTGLFFKKILRILGPGFITGASDDDPSGIGTYSQTGSLFGFKQLWTSLFTFPFMVVIQEMCARIGMVTGCGLGGVIKRNYSRWILFPLLLILVIANTINIGADLGAMASSAQMIFGMPFAFWLVIITILSLCLMVFVPYKSYVKYLKFLAISLLGYVFTVFVVRQDWSQVLRHTLVPTIEMNRQYMMNIVAVLGTTISPYLFFWQANEEAEEEVNSNMISGVGEGRPRINLRQISMMRLDTFIGMFFSNVISFFVIDATAITLGAHGMHNIQTATDAAQALRPIAGNFASLLFAIGIIGTGLMALPVLAGSAGYAVSETMGWKEGLSLKYYEAPKFYLVIVVIGLLGMGVHLLQIQPFQLLYYTAILNGVAAPPVMVMVLLICNNKKIMRQHKNQLVTNILGIFITVVMATAAIVMFVYI